jgi:hypothetical protein
LLAQIEALDPAEVGDVEELNRVEREMEQLMQQLDADELSLREILEGVVARFERGRPS